MLPSSACMCFCVMKCAIAWLHCLVLHGLMGLLVGSLVITEGEGESERRGDRLCVREREKGRREGKREGSRDDSPCKSVPLTCFLAGS